MKNQVKSTKRTKILKWTIIRADMDTSNFSKRINKAAGCNI